MNNNTVVIYDMAAFNILSTFFYEGGLTNNGDRTINVTHIEEG
jgi:hypothetical protein